MELQHPQREVDEVGSGIATKLTVRLPPHRSHPHAHSLTQSAISLAQHRSMGASDVVGNEVYFWGGYCGGVLPGEVDFYKLVVTMKVEDLDD